MPRTRYWLALVFALGVGAPALAQDTVDLKWKFEKGKTFYQELTTETKQEMNVQGNNISQPQTQTFFFSWTPEQQNDKDKSWLVKQKIEGVRMTMTIGGNTISYDSTKEQTGSNPLSEFFKALIGTEFRITIGPDMKVQKVEGRDEFVKKLVNANQQMQPLLNAILSDEAIKQMADPAFAVVPAKPVKKGESWEKKSTLSMGPIGSYESTYKYTDDGKDEKNTDIEKIKVESTLKYVPPTAGSQTGLPFKIVEGNLNGKDSSGTVLFDVKKGRVSSSSLSMKMEGTLKIDVNSQVSEVKLTQTQTTTVKTTDENPVKKAGT